MSERKIKLTALQDVKEFVNAAEQCDFDIDVFYNRVIIDAKINTRCAESGFEQRADREIWRTEHGF